MTTFLENLRHAQAELVERDADPFRRPIEKIMGCAGDCISTVALLDLLGLAPTAANARRIAPTMRALGFIPIKNRRFLPGGHLDSVSRGWAKPVRTIKTSESTTKGGKAADQPLSSSL